MKTAAELKYGERGVISDLDYSNPLSLRVLEYGFTPGQEIEALPVSIFHDPVAFALRGSVIAMSERGGRVN